MWTPAVAVIWESWRMTRRRLLLGPILATLFAGLLSRGATSTLAFVVLFAIAIAMAVSMPLFGPGAGFPLSKAFARPIRTSVLVAAPLAYVFAAAGVCYLVPATIVRLFTGVSFPLIPVSIVIGALAVLVAGCNWVTRSAMLRMPLVLGAFIASGMMFRFLDPFRNAAGSLVANKVVSPELFVLSETGYVSLGVFILVLYIWIALAVEWQRRGDEQLSFPHLGTTSQSRSGDIVVWIRNGCVELFRWRCPVSSPTAAEIWFELQYYGIPVLIIGALLSGCIALMVNWGQAARSAIPIVLAACTFAVPLLVGISASIWNRRNSSRVAVSAFEAARPIGTGKLIGLQVLITSLCISAAWMLMSMSFWLSYASASALTMDVVRQSGLRVLVQAIVSFVLLATLLAFLAALRALVSSYGWRVWMAAVALALYAIGVAFALGRDWVDEAVIGVNLWALAVAIPIGTLVILGKAMAGGAVSRRHVGVAALAWVPFGALCLYVLGGVDASSAVGALALAATLLPLAAVGLAPWSLSRIRHA
jgi:hypothetical protein